jgi:hypothetical protein
MVTELQFVAVAVFLMWGLVASLCGVLTAAPDAARLVWRRGDAKPDSPVPADDAEIRPNARQGGDRRTGT